MSKKVHILLEKIEEETIVLGLATPESFLPLILDFKTIVNYLLKPVTPIEIDKKGIVFKFSKAEAFIQESFYICLIKNKADGQVLLKEAKSFDYLLVIRGENCLQAKTIITESLKKLPHISLLRTLDIPIPKTLEKIINAGR